MSDILRQTVNIVLTFAAQGTLSFNLLRPINWIPDEMIVRSITYFNDGTEPGVSSIQINIGDNIPAIGYITDTRDTYCPNSIFPIKRPVQGRFNVTLINNTGALDIARQGQLAILLEFIKYN